MTTRVGPTLPTCRSLAALYDIHGNLPALDAALAAVEREDIRQILIGGDVVLGPMPRETLARVRELGNQAILIRGNCDRLVADPESVEVERLPPTVRETVEWTAAQLSAEERDFLGTLPMTATLRVEGIGDVLFCHATPRSDEELFTAQSATEQVAPMFAGVTTQLVVCGHTHMQFDRQVQGRRIVNAGSVGMPYGRPGAYWLRLGPGIEHRRTEYDLAEAAAAVRSTAYPRADAFASARVLSPPSESEMLKVFSGVR